MSQTDAEALARLESNSHDMSARLVAVQSGITGISTPLSSVPNKLDAIEERLLAIETCMATLSFPSSPNSPTPQDPNLIVSRAIQKPTVLRELCDVTRVRTKRDTSELVLSTYPTWEEITVQSKVWSILGNDFTCLCRNRPVSEHRNFARGSFGTLSVVTATKAHRSWCPAAQRACAQRTWRVNLEYKGLKRILKAALRLSFELKSGVGGWSISPGFAYRPTVDADTAPAFRILDILDSAQNWVHLCHKRRGCTYCLLSQRHCCNNLQIRVSWDTVLWEKLVALALAKLSELFRTGKASPLAVDSHNRSLAHYTAYLVRDGPNNLQRPPPLLC